MNKKSLFLIISILYILNNHAAENALQQNASSKTNDFHVALGIAIALAPFTIETLFESQNQLYAMLYDCNYNTRSEALDIIEKSSFWQLYRREYTQNIFTFLCATGISFMLNDSSCAEGTLAAIIALSTAKHMCWPSVEIFYSKKPYDILFSSYQKLNTSETIKELREKKRKIKNISATTIREKIKATLAEDKLFHSLLNPNTLCNTNNTAEKKSSHSNTLYAYYTKIGLLANNNQSQDYYLPNKKRLLQKLDSTQLKTSYPITKTIEPLIVNNMPLEDFQRILGETIERCPKQYKNEQIEEINKKLIPLKQAALRKYLLYETINALPSLLIITAAALLPDIENPQ